MTVYDPSLGFATGGGWFPWPETSDKTNIGFTMKYGRNGSRVKGNLLVIRHLPGSTHRVSGWASFTDSLFSSA